MTIFKHNSYLSFLKTWLNDQPKAGRGIKGQIAKELGISTTLVSFFFSGDKVPTLEQASDLADFIGLSEHEAQYMITLVEIERAGHSRLKQRISQRAKKEKEEGLRLKSKVKRDKRLNEEESSLYYSSWIFTGVRNLIAIPEINHPKQISERLNISIPMVNQALQVMLSMGLIVKTKEGLEIGPTYTYIDEESPHVGQYRKNWRLRGFDSMKHAFSTLTV